MFANLIKSIFAKGVLAAGLLASVSVFALPQPAAADARSTAAIAAAAALIVGAIAYDNGGRAYYVRDGRRWFVDRDVAQYYLEHRWDRDHGRFGHMPPRPHRFIR